MAKANKQKNNAEGKYEQICREYVERDELEKLNQRAAERVHKMECLIYEREKRAEEIRQKQERKFCAAVKMVFLVVIAVTAIAALLILAYTEAFAWWISIVASILLALPTTFKAGWVWYEFKH